MMNNIVTQYCLNIDGNELLTYFLLIKDRIFKSFIQESKTKGILAIDNFIVQHLFSNGLLLEI